MEAHLHFVKDRLFGLTVDRPLIISGPCSAESEEQVVATARALAALNRVHVLRAGIWKPRTRPSAFEGMGRPALAWLRVAQEASGLPTAVEVANSRHVEQALAAGISILWIGARTTANPFAVQEIADALKGTDVPILVKNPVNPDIELWIGALERINKAGITQLGAIHRGFSTFERTRYRNKPNWEIPIELKRRVPGLPIICDPSHICGSTELIQAVSQTALDLNFDGLMIEAHIRPAEALSDAKQQLTPHQLDGLLAQLVYRHESIDDVLTRTKLVELREKIDKIDRDLLEILADRMSVAEEIGQYKKSNNITILQSGRWDEIVHNRMKIGLEKNLTAEFIHKLFEIIHTESIHHQSRVMNIAASVEETPASEEVTATTQQGE
jgi:chorismate mutase